MAKRTLAFHALLFAMLVHAPIMSARPAYKRALAEHFGPFLAKSLNHCRLCHVADQPTEENHEHTPFGARLSVVKDELCKQGKKTDIP